MNRFQKNSISINIVLVSLSLLTYTVLRIQNTLLRAIPKSDEHSFLAVFKLFLKEGYYNANVYGNSIVFNNFSFLFYKLGFNELLSLKLTSLFFGFLSLVLLWYFQRRYYTHLPRKYKLVAYITSANVIIVMSFIFSGINDSILSTFIIIFFICVYELNQNKKANTIFYILIGVILSLMLLTRLISIVLFFPMLFILLSHFYYKKHSLRKNIIDGALIIVPFLILLIVLNLPSIKEKGKLSFHEKKIDTGEITWVQLQYLTEIGVEEGKVNYREHYRPEKVKEYLIENGENSLPRTVSEAIFFRPKRTIKVFFRELIFQIQPFTRLLGFFFILNIALFFLYLYRKKITFKKVIQTPIFLFTILYVGVICIIVSSYVEARWFLSLLLLLPFLFIENVCKFKKEIPRINNFDFIVLNLQLLSLLIMNVPYIYRNLNVFI
jgi:hypothetical protein